MEILLILYTVRYHHVIIKKWIEFTDNQKNQKKNTKHEQSKHEALKNLEVGSVPCSSETKLKPECTVFSIKH